MSLSTLREIIFEEITENSRFLPERMAVPMKDEKSIILCDIIKEVNLYRRFK